MARRAERPIVSADVVGIFRIIAVGSVILTGAVLWGYAVFHVAMRTM
jgi:hypothetical protein